MKRTTLIIWCICIAIIQLIIFGTAYNRELTKSEELTAKLQRNNYTQVSINCGLYNFLVNTSLGIVLATEKVVDADGMVVLKVPESTRIAFDDSGAIITCTTDEAIIATISSEQRFPNTRR